MQRIQIYRIICLLTFFLTPLVFLWENNFQLALEKLNDKPYAFHWIPEILSLFFFGMLITNVGQSCSNRFPRTKDTIKRTFLLSFFTIGSVLLCLNLLVLRNLQPTAFVGFFWGSMPMLGYLIETRMISHAK